MSGGPARAAAPGSDGVIHLAFEARRQRGTPTDARAVAAFTAGLAGSGKPLVISGATLAVPGCLATERDELIAADCGPHREP